MKNRIKLNVFFLVIFITFSSQLNAADSIIPLPKPSVDVETKVITAKKKLIYPRKKPEIKKEESIDIEAKDENLIEAAQCDLMFIPLVAFDSKCNRIGMGGGYYDKTLAFKKGGEFKNKTLLVGLAYEFQKIDSIEKNAWEIPMDAIITEDKTYKA